MHKNKEEQKRTPKLYNKHLLMKSFITIGVMVLLIAAMIALFVHSLTLQLYELRSASLGQTMEKNVQIMNTVINNEWDRLKYTSHELSNKPPSTQAELLERLADYHRIESIFDSWKLSCIDSSGILYGWDGDVARWLLPDMLLGDRSAYQITISETRDSGEESMIFLYRLSEPIKLTGDNIVLTHAILTYDMSAFGEMLGVSDFEGKSFSYITEENGTRLYHQQNQNEFIAAYNILTALQNFRFLYDEDYDNLQASIRDNKPYTAAIERDGQRYFVAYAPLSINGWTLFLFVPEANVSGNASSFIGLLLVEVGLIALLLTVLISLFIWTNSRQTLAKQQLAIDKAYQATQAKSSFLSHMSHDIRTPLNGIMGMCHIAKQHLGDDEATLDCLNKIDLSSAQLMALVNDVLDMSRIEQGKVEIRPIPVDLNNLISTCTVYIEVSTKENGIAFELDTTDIRQPLVSADPVLLEKILSNLLGNASKFTPAGGQVKLRVSQVGEESGQGVYRFEVADTGVGMKPEFLEHLFEPFSQEHSGIRTRYQGTGLGLSIVKSLVDKLGGKIEVDSVLGEGSTFAVTLPLEYASSADFPAEQEASKPALSGLRALLVEDNELNRIIAVHILEECGLAVDTAANGAVAVETFQSAAPGKYDFIFMDLRMPVMDGLEASRRIRALPREDAAAVPIIALTADALSDDIEKVHDAGMDEHLGKPIDLNKLYTVLRNFHPNGKNPQEPLN